ncbi:MAG: hypothetical protein AAFP77_19220 [Bacteroidota bacterium]
MTFIQLFVVGAGIALLLFGIRFFRETKMGSLMAFLVAYFLLKNAFYGDLSQSGDKQAAFKNAELAEIQSITIFPSQRRDVLTADTLRITSNVEIERIQQCLSKTKQTLKGNKGEDWACVLKIQKDDTEEIFAGISKSGNQTIIEMYSEGEYGVNYGSMINNELGVVLEEIILDHAQ